MGRLTDKNILITGGNSGIGLAAAQEWRPHRYRHVPGLRAQSRRERGERDPRIGTV